MFIKNLEARHVSHKTLEKELKNSAKFFQKTQEKLIFLQKIMKIQKNLK